MAMNRYISPDVDIQMRTMIDIMVEGWKDVIAGYFSHLFNDRAVLINWIRMSTISMEGNFMVRHRLRNSLVTA